MKPLRYTLVADGSSDRALIPVINWVLNEMVDVASLGYRAQFANPKIRCPGKRMGFQARSLNPFYDSLAM